MDIRGVYRFSSLVKQDKKGTITLSFASPDFFFKFFLCYEVTVKQKNYKRSTYYYLEGPYAGGMYHHDVTMCYYDMTMMLRILESLPPSSESQLPCYGCHHKEHEQHRRMQVLYHSSEIPSRTT
jgi:hypothetical protein